MIPPFFRRCPNCGHIGPSRRFRFVSNDATQRLVACPSCGHRFEPIDDPRLQ